MHVNYISTPIFGTVKFRNTKTHLIKHKSDKIKIVIKKGNHFVGMKIPNLVFIQFFKRLAIKNTTYHFQQVLSMEFL